MAGLLLTSVECIGPALGSSWGGVGNSALHSIIPNSSEPEASQKPSGKMRTAWVEMVTCDAVREGADCTTVRCL